MTTLVQEVVACERLSFDEAAVHFIGQKAMKSLHGRFFNDFSLTDCISFPMMDATLSGKGYRFLGEVFVCPEVALAYARKTKGDPAFEITLYVVHGLLHLMGYDDIKEKDRMRMRAAEERQMRHLSRKRLILRPAAYKSHNWEVACT